MPSLDFVRAAAINNPRKWASLLPPEEAARLLRGVDNTAYERALNRLQEDAELVHQPVQKDSELLRRLKAREAQIEIQGRL